MSHFLNARHSTQVNPYQIEKSDILFFNFFFENITAFVLKLIKRNLFDFRYNK